MHQTKVELQIQYPPIHWEGIKPKQRCKSINPPTTIHWEGFKPQLRCKSRGVPLTPSLLNDCDAPRNRSLNGCLVYRMRYNEQLTSVYLFYYSSFFSLLFVLCYPSILLFLVYLFLVYFLNCIFFSSFCRIACCFSYFILFLYCFFQSGV